MAMARIRFRLRTLMIIVAFVALILVVVIQGVYLKRASEELKIYRVIEARDQALAELQLAARQKTLEQSRARTKEFLKRVDPLLGDDGKKEFLERMNQLLGDDEKKE
jgi:uncharacterized membrane protein affecting hemolysin expression